MDLYFLRHGSAGSPRKDPKEDAARGLDQEGRQQCELVGDMLVMLGVKFDEIISSPMRRASEAAAIVAKRTRYKHDIALALALRPDATYGRFLELLSEVEDEKRVLLVGHNSRIAEFVGKLISNGTMHTAIHLKKGAIAKVVKKRSGANLQWCLPPKLLRAYLIQPDRDRHRRGGRH
jgi:phosphohistidine phosphatase